MFLGEHDFGNVSVLTLILEIFKLQAPSLLLNDRVLIGSSRQRE